MTIAVLIALTAATAAPVAASHADPAALDREVARFTGAAIGAPVGAVRPIDRRLRLTVCAGEIALDWRTARRDTVIVRCTDPGGWRLFVPVMVSTPGGSAATPAASAPVVSRGDAVSLSVSGRGFAVSRPAEALEAGAVGDWIRVRPVTERRLAEEPVRARIVRPGVVSLPVG
jgi:flagellar basal body P-ring formation protein FlgA